MAHIKLYYFDFAGKGEPARLLLTIGNLPFQDIRVTMDKWPQTKANMPWGQMPVLEVGDQMLAQSAAIDRYCAKIAGLLPDDPWRAALCDQLYSFLSEDLWHVLYNERTRVYTADGEQRRKALEEIGAEPALTRHMQIFNDMLEAHADPWLGGDRPSHADALAFTWLCNLQTNAWEGLPKDLLQPYPVLRAYRNRFASLPAVAAYYANAKEPPHTAFQADTPVL